MKHVDYKNTRGSNMDEPLWFDPKGKRPGNLSPEENARRDALLKKLDEIMPGIPVPDEKWRELHK